MPADLRLGRVVVHAADPLEMISRGAMEEVASLLERRVDME